MAAYFFDSSAAVKRYSNETGTNWVKGIADPAAGNKIYIALITGAEVVSAIARKARSGGLSAIDASRAIADFRLDFTSVYRTVEVTFDLIKKAMEIAEKHTLRGYDAVQLAVALGVNVYWLNLGMPALTLVSADADLNTAALTEGLAVEDPNDHP